MSDQNAQQRRDNRAIIELDIDLSTYGRYHLSRLSNLSIGGAFVRSDKLYSVGTCIHLRFKLPGDDRPIEAQGDVVWTYDQPISSGPNSSGIGIKFSHIVQEDRDRIRAFVSRSTNHEE